MCQNIKKGQKDSKRIEKGLKKDPKGLKKDPKGLKQGLFPDSLLEERVWYWERSGGYHFRKGQKDCPDCQVYYIYI